MSTSNPFGKNGEAIGNYVTSLRRDGLILEADHGSVNSIRKAKHYISRVGISRFNEYYYPFKETVKAGNAQKVGVEDVLKLYKFDRKLRLLCLDALERIEVAAKNHVFFELEELYGENWLIKSNQVIHQGMNNQIANQSGFVV